MNFFNLIPLPVEPLYHDMKHNIGDSWIGEDTAVVPPYHSMDLLSGCVDSLAWINHKRTTSSDIFEGLINGKAAIAHTEPNHFENSPSSRKSILLCLLLDAGPVDCNKSGCGFCRCIDIISCLQKRQMSHILRLAQKEGEREERTRLKAAPNRKHTKT